jgi:ubiquinone/menaquinone biosynthesis C-methylase UbiE
VIRVTLTTGYRMGSDREIERLTNVYREYSPTVAGRWNTENRGNLMIRAELERKIEDLLRSRELLPLTESKILDVGCGYGFFLLAMQVLGASPANVHGIDLLPERIEVARSTHPGIALQVGNAEELPYTDASFDLVILSTVFTSVLDPTMRANIAGEVSRVLRREGSILWYDFRYDNPWNPHVRGMRRADVAKVFPGFALDLETVTPLPQLARRLGPLTSTLYPVLAAVPVLRTHYLGLLTRPPQNTSASRASDHVSLRS